MNDQDFDVQPAEETDAVLDNLRAFPTEAEKKDAFSTTEYLEFAARCDAERDCDNGIAPHIGIASLVVAQLHADCTLTIAEVEAYRTFYNAHAAARLARDAGIQVVP